jgi:hypothetical protein
MCGDAIAVWSRIGDIHWQKLLRDARTTGSIPRCRSILSTLTVRSGPFSRNHVEVLRVFNGHLRTFWLQLWQKQVGVSRIARMVRSCRSLVSATGQQTSIQKAQRAIPIASRPRCFRVPPLQGCVM